MMTNDKKTVADDHDDELLVDEKTMTKEQLEVLEVAESAREKEYTQPSFGRQLFMGTFASEMMHPFPEQTPEDKKIGDELVAKAIAFLEANHDAEETDRTRTISEEVMNGLKELGLFKMKVPKEYGGLGLSQVNYNRVMMAVTSICGATSVLLSAHQSIGVPMPLKMFGTPEQKKKYFTMMADGAISAFALTEPEVGSDPAQMTTTAELSEDGSHYVINGDKLWCTNGPISELLVVMARTKPKMVRGKEKQQITAFIVETNTPGFEVVHRCDFMGIRGIHNGLLRFTNLKVPAENILWGEGRGLALALRTLNTGRLTLPAGSAALGKQCLNICKKWGNERVQWGKPIGEHEAGADKLAYIASTTLATEAIAWITSHWADKGEFDIRIEAAMAKLWTSEAAWQMIDKTLQLRGGRGYETSASLKARGEKVYPVERMMRDTRINMIIEGTSEIMRLFLAREALDPHLKLAKDLLSKRTSAATKAACAAKLTAFYGTWYPARWLKSLFVPPHSEMGRLAQHYRFIERTSHKLARTLFHKMAAWGANLEKRQMILGALVEIGSELFAMAATCAYVKSITQMPEDKCPSIELADHFCHLARQRIEAHFQTLYVGNEKRANKIAKRVLAREMEWLEEGISAL